MRGSRRTAALALAAGVLAAGCNVYAPSWSAVHADGANSDYAPVEGARDVERAWTASFEGTINLGPTVDPQGQVYVTNSGGDCHLHALDARTGETRWCSTEVDTFAVASSPLIDRDGRLFLADGEAMHAFSRDGTLLWETPIEGVPLSAQFTPNGRIVFVTHIGRVYVLYRENGRHVLPPVELVPGATWDRSQGMRACAQGTSDCPSANTPAIDLRTGRLIFTFWTPGAPAAGVRAMRITEDPRPALVPLWTNDALPGGSASSPALSPDGSRVYVNDNAGNVHALDAATGEEIWSFPIGFASGGSASLSPGGLLVPAGGGASPLLALQDEGDHATLAWRNDALLNRGIATQADGDVAYVTAATGRQWVNDLVVVDTRTGAEVDREPLPGISVFTVGTTVGPDRRVYVPTLAGEVHAFEPA